MTNADIREAHKLLDSLFDNSELSHEQIALIRGLVPGRPKQKTLEEITIHVLDAWSCTSDNDWGGDGFDPDVAIEDWLGELHAQLKGLEDAPTTVPAHPEFLETEADYENAPVGTVVTMDGVGSAWVKEQYGWPGIRDSIASSAYTMAELRRRVLRWGWGK